MSLVRIDSVGAHGIITDISAYELPPEAWSAGQNVRFKDQKVRKMLGHESRLGTPSIVPYSLFSVQTPTTVYWAYCGLTKVYGTDNSTHFNLTRQSAGVDVDYAASAESKWNGGVLNGLLVLNNGTDIPQYWSPVSSAQRLQDLANWSTWPGGSSTRCKVLRPAFRYYLVALNITESGTQYPQVLAWGNPAEPGAVPTSWDYASTSTRARRTPVADTPGALLDLIMLGGVGVLYKEDSIYTMQLIGGNDVFKIDTTPLKLGLLATNCAAQLPGFHFAVTQDDIIVHNTREARSVISERVRNIIFDNIDQTYKGRSYVVPNYKKSEMWFCYPESGQAQPTKAFVWNYENQTTSFRELGAQTPHIGVGTVPASTVNTTWDADTGVWDSDTTIWDERLYDPANTQLLMAQASSLYLADSSNQFAGVNMNAYVERQGITIVGRDRQGAPKIDQDSIKYIRRVLPRITGSPVNIYVGEQNIKNGAITWSAPRAFDPATMNEALFDSVSRFPAIKFESLTNVDWSLEGYALDMELVGRY